MCVGLNVTRRPVAAIGEMRVLVGQRIERRDVGAPGEFDALNDDQLEHALLERFSALGLAGVIRGTDQRGHSEPAAPLPMLDPQPLAPGK
jgi:hypothetical protein